MNLLDKIIKVDAEVAEKKQRLIELSNQYAKQNAKFREGDEVEWSEMNSDNRSNWKETHTGMISKVGYHVWGQKTGIFYDIIEPYSIDTGYTRVYEKETNINKVKDPEP